MNFDDLKKLLASQALFRLDAILAMRLVPILYGLGLAGILLWAVNHLFARFGSSFSNGLWGLLEIAVFGLLAVVALRLVCEALLVWFKAHEGAADTLSQARLVSASLLDDVREAIRDLADEVEEPPDPYLDYSEGDSYSTPPDLPPRGAAVAATPQPPPPPPIRRTARRAPKDTL